MHVSQIRKANVMFLNNFGGWWSSEKSGPSTRSLEDQVIELLKETAEGRWKIWVPLQADVHVVISLGSLRDTNCHTVSFV